MPHPHQMPGSRRRFLTAGASVLFGLPLLAACSNPSAPPPTAVASPKAAAPTPAPAATTPAAQPTGATQASTTIAVRFNGLATGSTDYVKKFVADWNGKQKIHIAPDFTDWSSSFQKITTGIAGGIAPDVYAAGGLWTPVMSTNGGAKILDDYLKNYQDWNDWYPAAQKDGVWNGKTYSIAYETGVQGMVGYQPDLYKKAGITNPPTTWDEARAFAKQLVQRTGDTITVAGWDFLANNTLSTQSYEDAIDQAGGHIFSEDKAKPTNNTPEGEAALSFLVGFVQDKSMPPQGTPGAMPTLNGWATGKVAQGRVAYTDLQYTHQYNPTLYQNTQVAASLKQVKQAQVLYVDKYMMYSKSKEPDAAWEVLQGLIAPDVLIAIYVQGDWATPARKAMANAKLYDDPRMKAVADGVNYALAREAVPQSFDVQPAMSREVEAAVRGTKSVKQALQDMDTAVAKILKG